MKRLNKKGAVMLRSILIVIVVALMVGLGISQLANNLANTYDTNVDESFTNSLTGFNETSMNEMYLWSKEIQNKTEIEQGVSETTGEAVFTASSFKITKTTFSLFGMMWSMINSPVKSISEIPAWFITGCLIIITIVVVFAVLSALFRKDT